MILKHPPSTELESYSLVMIISIKLFKHLQGDSPTYSLDNLDIARINATCRVPEHIYVHLILLGT